MKNFFKNGEFQLDEILFESRNRAYGAYMLRQDSDRILTRSMFYGVGLFAAAAVLPLVFNQVKTKEPVIISDYGPHRLREVRQVEIPKNPVAPQITPPKTATFDSSVPTPSHAPKAEKPAAKIDAYEKAVAGTQDVKGEISSSPYTPPATAPAVAPVVPTAPPVVADPPKDLDKIETAVDVEASFAGGVDAFRSKVQNGFDISAFESSGETLKTIVTFVVERDGTISNIKATGSDAQFNREAENTIRRIKGKWAPAKLKGQAVRSYFRFPITMAFE